MLRLSVIIATYNRARSLADVLDSLALQENDAAYDHEIIIADNNSSDETRSVVDSFQGRFGKRLKYVFVPEQGKSKALNRAVGLSDADVLVFTDDDCVADTSWLKNIALAFMAADAACIFGRILPRWPTATPPLWLSSSTRFWGELALLDYGGQMKKVSSDNELFYGANFAITRAVLTDTGLFNADLGPKGRSVSLGEDTDLFLRLLDAGQIMQYNPAMLVYHKVPLNRTRKSYFRKWRLRSGSYIARSFAGSKPGFFGIPLWFLKKSFFTLMKYIYFAVTFNTIEGFRYELKCYSILGSCLECISQKVKRCLK
jgi:glucosyl-dolichyl phosphate glucuronosyltransferase